MRLNLNFIIYLVGCWININLVYVSNADETSTSDASTLKLVQVLYRHGDRNIIDPYPNAEYKDEKFWPGGFGQLTKLGKMQQYEVGQWLRVRYSDYLNASYSPYEIYVQASDVDRTMMSAEANLAGLYPPNDDWSRWNPNLSWQPIPVHSKGPHDRYLKMDANCTKLQKLTDDFLTNSPIVKKLNEEYKDIFELLTNKTGRKIQTPDNVDYIYDVLYISHLKYGTWPDWAPEGSRVLQAMKYLTKFSFRALSYTEEMQRLKGGPLLKEMLELFEERVKGTLDKRRKFFMYSAHDTTVAVLLNTMGVFDPPQIPSYTCMIILELHEDRSNNNSSDPDGYIIKVSLRNDTNRDPYTLSIPGCDNPCTLKQFRTALAAKIPDNWDKECEQSFYDSIGIGVTFLVIGSLSIFLLVILSVCVGLYKSRRRNESKTPAYPYLHLQMEDEEA